MNGLGSILAKLLTGLAIFLLISCGGGSGGDGGIVGTGLRGTAAIGAAIKNTKLLIKDSTGKQVEATTNENGKFSSPVSGLVPPYILKITAPGNRELYSYALTDGVSNLTPLTDLVTRNVFKTAGGDVEVAFAAAGGLNNPPSPQKADATSTSFAKLLALAYQAYSVQNGFDLFRTEFDPNGAAFDALLDNLAVTFSGAGFTVDFIDPTTGLVAKAIERPNLNFDYTQADVQKPSVPTHVKAIPASNSSVTIAWKSALDNVGVAGYNVYRGDNKIATVPVSVYRDTGLAPSTEYCYRIEAVDGAENVSNEKSAQSCAKTPATTNIVPPSVVTGVAAVGSANTAVNVTWKQSTASSVLGYSVYRKLGAVYVKIATVFTPGYVDRSVTANTQYCYKVEVFDAANTASPQSAETCTTAASPTSVAQLSSLTLPGGGTYSTAQIVSILCFDNSGPGCAITYFTVDGSEPTIKSDVFVEPIRITDTTTLKYFSVDNNGNAETIKTEIYTF